MWISANGHGGQILAHVPVYLLCMSYRFSFNKYLAFSWTAMPALLFNT